MSDSEDTKPGASSALLNIASAYSDSDSSQENTEDCAPQKSLGSLVENLRAEANRFDGDVTKITEHGCSTFTPSGPSPDAEKAQSVTKIVRLDSGKVVKIKTSSGSKVPEVRHEETLSKTGINIADSGKKTQDISTLQPNDPGKETKSEGSVQCGVTTGVLDLETRTSNDKNRFEGVNSATSIVNPRVLNSDSVNAETPPAMGMRNTKEDVKPDDDVIIESETLVNPPKEVLAKTSVPGSRCVERLPYPPEQSKHWVSGTGSVLTSECDVEDDDIQDVTPVDVIQGTTGLKTTQKEQHKTESNILNAYLKSKRGLKTDDNAYKNTAMEKNYETNRNPEIMFLSRSFEIGFDKSGTAGSVAGSNVNIPAGGEGVAKSDESLRGLSAEEGLVSKLDIYEVKPRPELKPLPRVDRIKVRSTLSGLEGQLKKTEQERQSSSTLYKILESPSISEVKKGPSPAPIKLKRNFSCISSASNVQPEKKFIPEPSESARITSTDSEVSSDVPAGSSIPEITVIPAETRPQKEETVKSPPRIQIPSPSRSALSPAYQQVSPHSYQPSFTNMINTSPNQVPTFQPLKKSPQPVSPQPLQRNSRREETKRTLPLILRKADISSSKARESHRIDESGAKAPFRKEDVSASSKMISEGDISVETISLESQEQSASLPFSNCSSNQENSNFSSPVNFESVIGSSVASKKPETLSEDGGSDNARPPPTPTKDERDEKQQTSFLSQQVEPVEMPTIIIPKKRGRPRKFPLPEPSTLVGTWPTADKNDKSTSKSGKRKKNYKKFKGEPDITDDDDTSKKRYIPRYKKKTKPTGEEAEVTRSFNKKGRMEVVTEGCKPVTVNQITEYFWPPVSSLPPGEKPEGLMIQEQISEYLGVKSFKRKYPSIKRRTVDMEERNYLQENGYVSENMCDMGLTAVYSADIMEIMYNDFPHKFEEYRRYTREKKMREQKALREKQAAENMDPRKEALESIVSWNTEFNSSRKMDKPKRNYNHRVLLGEWYERKVDEELKIALYLKKKERGQLLLTKIRRLFSNLLKDVQLTLSTTGLAHGGLVQLIAPDVPGYPSTSVGATNNGLVLAVTMEADDVDYNQDFDDNMPVVGSPALAPCARNSFYIVPEDGRKEGQSLCFGDVFFLKCGGYTEVPFYVTVPTLSPFTTVGKSGYPVPRLCTQKSFDSRFKVYHVSEHLRKETLGLPVSPFEKVLIVHAPVNVPLCVEKWCWKNSLFSAECEVSVRSTLNVQKEYDEANKWIFTVGSVK